MRIINGGCLIAAVVTSILICGSAVLADTWDLHLQKARQYEDCGLLDNAVAECRAALTDGAPSSPVKSEISRLEYAVIKSRLTINTSILPLELLAMPDAFKGVFVEMKGVVLSERENTGLCRIDIGGLSIPLMTPACDYLTPGRAVTFIARPSPAGKSSVEIVALKADAAEGSALKTALSSRGEAYEEYIPEEVVPADDPPVRRAAARRPARPVVPGKPAAKTASSDKDTPDRASAAVSWQSCVAAYASAVRRFNSRIPEASARSIAATILKYSTDYKVDPRLVMAVVAVESGFRPDATSPAGAAGLGQLMPGTAAGIGVKDRYDPVQSIWGAVRILKGHLGKWRNYSKDVQYSLALASYNAGPGAVSKYGGVPPYRETQNYIRKVIALYKAFCG